MIQTITKDWLPIFLHELKNTQNVLIISPFISENIVDHLLGKRSPSSVIKLITRFNLNDFKSGVSSLKALRKLVDSGIEIKGIKSLHSKVYCFDTKSTIIGSANFTSGGFFNNYEFGLKSEEANTIRESINYFERLWSFSPDVLSMDKIEKWEEEIRLSKPTPATPSLPDYGKKAISRRTGKRKYFIKFFGKSDHREDFDFTAKEELKRSHCHWALTFSENKGRPRRYNTGDVVYMARMLEGREYAIFGRGVALRHVDSRDKASDEDEEKITWKKDWPIYIRVKETEFIDGTMEECPLMSDLIDELRYECFVSTLRRHNYGAKNINPWLSLGQQPDVQISELGAEWMENKFNEAKNTSGLISSDFISGLYSGTPTIKEILSKE